MRSLLKRIVVLLAGLMPVVLSAQNNDVREGVEEIITIGNRFHTGSRLVLPSLQTVEREEIERVAHAHVQEQLSRLPGVNLQRGSGQEYLPAVRSPVLTGAGACGSVMVSENNIPVRAAGFCNINELFDAHTEQAQRLEVLRGPGNAATGSNALTGGINTYLGADTDTALYLEAGANSWGRARLRHGYGQAGNRSALYLTSTHDGGFRDSAGFDQHKLSYRNHRSLEQSELASGFTLAYLDQQTAGFIVGENSYLDKALSRQNPNPDAFRESIAFRAWSSYKRQLDSGAELSITPFVRWTDMDFLLHFAPGTPLEQNKQRSIGIQSALSWQSSDTLSLLAGIDLDIARGELVETQNAPTQGSAFLRETVPSGIHYDYQVDAYNISTHVRAEWKIRDQLQLNFGVRLEHQTYDYDNRSLDGRTRTDGSTCGFGGCRFSRPADRTDRYTNLSPRLELVYLPNAQSRIYAIAATSARAPQATELYRLQRQQTVADLGSEKATSLELGYQYQSDQVQADIAIWGMRKRNVIFRDADFFNVSNGKTGHYGAEAALSLALSPAFTVSTSLTLSRHTYRNNLGIGNSNIDGNRIDTAPDFYGDLRFSWRPLESLSIELQAHKMGKYFLEPDNLFEYAGHTVYHLRARAQISRHWSAYARLINITDRRYADRADFTRFTAHRYFPGAPRSLFLGVEWRPAGKTER